ncbi:hypothetical protein [Pseudomonas sp. 22 E 5]|nr:hypothetical protein [Pseudomonas sp. 22 E 5]
MFILARSLPSKAVIAIALNAAIRQLLFKQLTTLIPDQPMTAVIWIPNLGQLPAFVVAVVSRMAVRIGLTRNIALFITLIFPDRLTPPYNPYESIVMLVGCWLIIPKKHRHQTSSFVVLVGRDRPQRILLNRQPSLVIVGFEVLSTVRIHPLHQPRPLVMHVDFLAAIGV